MDIRSYWNFEDPAASEARFDELLSKLPPDASDDLRAEILTQKARARGLQRRFEEARETLSEAKSLLASGPTSGNAAYELEAGRVENSSGNQQIARSRFLTALELAEQGGHDFLAVDAAHMLGIVDKGEDSLRWNEHAISLAESSEHPRARNFLGSLLNNTGWTYYDMGRLDQAMDLFVKALEFRKLQGQRANILIARYCIAKCLRAQGNPEKAIELQLELVKDHVSGDAEPGYSYEEIAECLLACGRNAEARPYFAKAHSVLSRDEWLMDSEPERVQRLARMAGIDAEPSLARDSRL